MAMIRNVLSALVGVLALFWRESPATVAERVILPRTGIEAQELGLVVNDEDPLSIRIASYYQAKRNIPVHHVIHVRFKPGQASLSDQEFAALRQSIAAQTSPTIQAYALAWSMPFRVGCMSLSAALALGHDKAYCSSKQCAATKPSPYFNSTSLSPYSDLGIRPTMHLGGLNFESIKRLVDRGSAADFTYPTGVGYLLRTSDKHRTVREVTFDETVEKLGEAFSLRVLRADLLVKRKDVLFYFTGLAKVQGLDTLGFLPGAVADHLTSVGGVLNGTSQMSILRWLEAGASGSYGTAVEPCNHLQKFSVPGVLMWFYAQGNTLIEAYWKSVHWPGEGVFVGEPLARPFAPRVTAQDDRTFVLQVFSATVGSVVIESGRTGLGPFDALERVLPLTPGANRFELDLIGDDEHAERYYRVRLIATQAGK